MAQDTTNPSTGLGAYDPQYGIDFSDLIYALWKGKWFIGLSTALAIFAGGYYAFVLVTPVYRSSTVVILEPTKDKVVTFQSVSSGLTGGTPEVNSEVEILRARSLMHDVVDHLNLFDDPEFNRSLTPPTAKVVMKSRIKQKLGWSAPPEILSPTNFDRRTRDSVVSALLHKVRIENLPKSAVFKITVHTKKATKAALIADTIAELYIQKQVAQKIETAAQATDWLEKRVAELQVDLENSETKAANFSASTALVSAEGLQALKRQIKALRERIITAEKTDIFAVNDATSIDDENVPSNPLRVNVNDNVAKSETKQIAANSELFQTNKELEALKVSEVELSKQAAKQGQDLISLQQLNREAEATRVLYEHFLSRLKETASQQGIQKADSRILSPAVIPYKPAEPRKSLILSMSAIFGLSASLCLILFGELRRTTFRSLHALERYLGIVGLARLPQLPTKRRTDFLAYLIANPTHWFPSTITSLRNSLLLSPTTRSEIIAVTSIGPNEGCSSSALALAHNFALLEKKVLLIDTNPTVDGLAAFFEDDPTRGIISILRGEHGVDQSLHRPEALGADILFMTEETTNAADLFLGKKFDKFIDDMQKRYDVVILNAPAIATTPSARAVLKLAPTVLLNIRWDHTTKRDINAASRLLHHAEISVSGVLMSEIETTNLTSKPNLSRIFKALTMRADTAAYQ